MPVGVTLPVIMGSALGVGPDAIALGFQIRDTERSRADAITLRHAAGAHNPQSSEAMSLAGTVCRVDGS